MDEEEKEIYLAARRLGRTVIEASWLVFAWRSVDASGLVFGQCGAKLWAFDGPKSIAGIDLSGTPEGDETMIATAEFVARTIGGL
jgi:hypothetical protein